jgi:hypothetical protein
MNALEELDQLVSTEKQERLRKITRLREIIRPVPIKFDGLMSALLGQLEIDVIQLDEEFAKYDPEYRASTAQYRSQDCSMSAYVFVKYGNEALELLNDLLGGTNE